MPVSNVDVAFGELMPLIPVPWSIQAFVDRFAILRRRPIELEARPMPPLVPALLVVQSDLDTIWFDVLDSAEHCELHILHEIGHLAMGHTLITADTQTAAESTGQNGGCPYPPAEQAEADLLAATLITAVRSQPQHQAATELGRLTSTLL